MKISINKHSSIRIESDKVIYFDPYLIDEESHDADIIFITHEHHDHFSIEDIRKVEKEDTVYVIPDNMYNLLGGENVVVLNPNEKTEVEGYEVITIPSYNVGKPFHPKEKGNLAYIVTIEGKRVFVAGDTDKNEDNLQVRADIALVPVGGHYTMDHKEAAALVNAIRPQTAIPTHYGSEGIGDRKDGERFRELVDPEIRVEILIKEQA
ncbi:MAG: MBL fold metallo-hydrolase [Erysipelotrichaceae bacterium]|nr:MBL fold metallo-hydrolase [Erysipelotrichaceae bacterium]